MTKKYEHISYTPIATSVLWDKKLSIAAKGMYAIICATPPGWKVYFAAPLFNEAEREYNLYLTGILENYSYEVFLPQRDGFHATELDDLTEEEKAAVIFEKDKEALISELEEYLETTPL